MSTIRVHEARKIRGTLAALARNPRVPSDVRANTRYWARTVQGRMERRDVQTVAWILQSASDVEAVAARDRRAARYWGAYLEAMT